MTYCSSPPDYDINGYCADTPLHCTNTHVLQKNILECKKSVKFEADNSGSDDDLEPKQLTITS